MRITNKIMQYNALTNINKNKVLQDQLNTKMATGKNITKPSEDPVVAIRALRLRTNVSEITQYYEKNVPDAESWLSVTEEALSTVSDVITSMISQYTTGSNGDLTSTDRETILEQLKALREEVYSTANADYAGRTVFTGYRTDMSLTFTEDTTQAYSITEQLDIDSLDTTTYIDSSVLDSLTEANYSTTTTTETDISSTEVNRIRLAYDNLDQDATTTAPTLTYYDSTGTAVSITATIVSKNDTAINPYTDVPADEIYMIPETGELILGSNVYAALSGIQDDETTDVDEGEIQITYEKSDWEEGDLRPEHYFACTSDPGTADAIDYNSDYLTGTESKQVIEYDVGYNQSLQVNTTADECFTHDIGRDVDEMINALDDVTELEDLVSGLEEALTEYDESDAEYSVISANLDAANKALTLATDKMQKMFEDGISSMQDYLDQVNLATTNCGTRSARLELIETRLSSQQTAFETLQSSNEDADTTELAIELASASLSYEAALAATGKIAQTSLLNYI